MKATVASPPAVEPDADASVDRLLDTIHELAANRYGGRRVGSAGGRAAGEWLAERLRSIGATVHVDEFQVPIVPELYLTPVLRWRHHGQVSPLVHRRDFVEHLGSAEQPLPRTGRLAVADAAAWRDRWVLVPALTPQAAARAQDQGAAGLLVPRDSGAAGWLPKLLGGPAGGHVPVLAVRAELHHQMTTAANAGPAEVTASVPLRTVATTGANLHGMLAEPAPGMASVLLTAHRDGVGDDPDRRLPGAADNGSGVAVVLEAARQLGAARPAGMGLAVALLDAEEVGASGSARHSSQLAADTYVINVDGAGRLGDAAAVEAGGPAEPLLAALDRAGREVGVALRAGAVASDNRRYAAAGVPAIGLGMGVPGYHTPDDTPDRIDPATLLVATHLVTATVRRLTVQRNTTRS